MSEAADTMQEVPVETFGAMAKSEKIAFILEQVGAQGGWGCRGSGASWDSHDSCAAACSSGGRWLVPVNVAAGTGGQCMHCKL